jgi:hypothetical protein
MAMSERPSLPTRVRLPVDVQRPFEVYLNGIVQTEGADYMVADGSLVFTRKLEQEKVGKGKWTSMFFGIAGSYGKDDSVDVIYEVAGQPRVAAKLPFEPNS